MVEIHSHCSYI